jgi:hypothetical protein
MVEVKNTVEEGPIYIDVILYVNIDVEAGDSGEDL